MWRILRSPTSSRKRTGGLPGGILGIKASWGAPKGEETSACEGGEGPGGDDAHGGCLVRVLRCQPAPKFTPRQKAPRRRLTIVQSHCQTQEFPLKLLKLPR